MTTDVLPVNVSNRVAGVVDGYLADLLRSVPHLVDGVYLTGSVALGDFHPEWSDVDFVTVLRERPGKHDLRSLADIHERVAQACEAPRLDGWYLTWEDLRTARDFRRTTGLRARGSRMFGGRNWVPPVLVWHELAEHGLHVHGPQLSEHEIARDPEGVRQWCLETLETTWTPWWHANARLLSQAGFGSLGTWATATGVLGVARIRYTLQTGKITSKCGGGEWALQALDPRWHRIVEESLRIRNRPDRRSSYRSPLRRRRDALAFIDTVITEAEQFLGPAALAPPDTVEVTAGEPAPDEAVSGDPLASGTAVGETAAGETLAGETGPGRTGARETVAALTVTELSALEARVQSLPAVEDRHPGAVVERTATERAS